MTGCTCEWVKRCPPSRVDRACTTPAVIAAVSMATLAMRDTMGHCGGRRHAWRMGALAQSSLRR
eukprot:6200468-Pleurochrysis_carterae.AAC.1